MTHCDNIHLHINLIQPTLTQLELARRVLCGNSHVSSNVHGSLIHAYITEYMYINDACRAGIAQWLERWTRD